MKVKIIWLQCNYQSALNFTTVDKKKMFAACCTSDLTKMIFFFQYAYHEHGESFPKNSIKEALGACARHDEEITQEQVLPAAVVHQCKVQASEQHLECVLKDHETE